MCLSLLGAVPAGSQWRILNTMKTLATGKGLRKRMVA